MKLKKASANWAAVIILLAASCSVTTPSQAEEIPATPRNLSVEQLVGLLQKPSISWDERKQAGIELNSRAHKDVLPAIYNVLSSLPRREFAYGTDPYLRGEKLPPQEQVGVVAARVWSEHLKDYGNSREIGLILVDLLKKDEVKTERAFLLGGLDKHWVDEATDDVIAVLKAPAGENKYLAIFAAQALVTGIGTKANPLVIEAARKAPLELREAYVDAMISLKGSRKERPQVDPKAVAFGFESLQALMQDKDIHPQQANLLANIMEVYLATTFAPEEKKRLSDLSHAEAHVAYFARLAEHALAWWKINAKNYKT